MVISMSKLSPGHYSERFVESPDDLDDDLRFWWCGNCGAVFGRHHQTKNRLFCYNCEQRDAVLIEMKPVGPGSDTFGPSSTGAEQDGGRDD